MGCEGQEPAAHALSLGRQSPLTDEDGLNIRGLLRASLIYYRLCIPLISANLAYVAPYTLGYAQP